MCTERDHIYSAYINECYIECGDGTGKHPHCHCGKGFDLAYDIEAGMCKPIGYEGRPCPPGSLDIDPHCHCVLGTFEIYDWGCFEHYIYGPTGFP